MLQKRSPWCFKSVYPMKAKKINKIIIKKEQRRKERKKKGQNQGRKKDKLPFLKLESL